MEWVQVKVQGEWMVPAVLVEEGRAGGNGAQLSTTDFRPFLTSLQLFLQIRAQLTCRERFIDKTKYFPERRFLLYFSSLRRKIEENPVISGVFLSI